ncbi:MAG: hypothetical protein R3B13_29340 [Polyangiaceae bacterium]
MPSRRTFLGWTLGSGACLLTGARATASLARSLSLAEMVRASSSCVLATALAAESRWETIGPNRRIVTTTRVRVHENWGGLTAEGELLVRTLGGRVGDTGQIVHGEAMLLIGQRAGLFLLPEEGGRHALTGMAQGHYPSRRDDRGVERLRRSPRLPELVDDGGAQAQLAGQSLVDARKLVRKAFDAR